MLDLATINQVNLVAHWNYVLQIFPLNPALPRLKEQLRAIVLSIDFCMLTCFSSTLTVGLENSRSSLVRESSPWEAKLATNQWLPELQAGIWTEPWQTETPKIPCRHFKPLYLQGLELYSPLSQAVWDRMIHWRGVMYVGLTIATYPKGVYACRWRAPVDNEL